MPSLALATGAGAGKGLEDLLAEYRANDELALRKRAQDEVIRRDQATEAISNRQIDENAKYRQAVQDESVRNHQAAQESQLRDDIRAREQLRLPGTEVPQNEVDEATKIGRLPMSSYQQEEIGGHLSGDEQGPTIHEGTVFKGLRSNTQQAGPSYQEKTYSLNGKPVDANYDSKTGKVFDKATGADITAQVGHYEKPPAPDRVVMPVFDPNSGRTVLTRRGEAVGKDAPLTSSSRTMQEGARMLQPHIDDLKDQAVALDQKGLFGPMMSRVRHIAEQVGSLDDFFGALSDDPELSKDPAIGKFATSLGLLATGAGRVHGGARGGGSPQMLAHFKHLLADSSSLSMFLGRLDAVDDYMTGYANPGDTLGNTGGPKPATGGGGADLYDEYLRRPRK